MFFPFFAQTGARNIHCLPAQAEARPDLISIYGEIPDWDVGMVMNMSRLFAETSFNEPIGSWNTSAVTDMQDMFYKAEKFNQPIGYGAYVFDTPIGSLDISSLGRILSEQ